MKKLLLLASIPVFALAARPSHADAEKAANEANDMERFGDKKSLVIAGDFSFSFVREQGDESSYTGGGISPSVDYFILDHLSVGTGVSLAHSESSSFGIQSSVTTMALAPRIGYEVPLGKQFSLWPTVGLFHTRVLATDSPYYDNTGQWTLSGYVRAPLIAHVAKHFFIGGGPAFGVGLASSVDSQNSYGFGIHSMLGGWI